MNFHKKKAKSFVKSFFTKDLFSALGIKRDTTSKQLLNTLNIGRRLNLE